MGFFAFSVLVDLRVATLLALVLGAESALTSSFLAATADVTRGFDERFDERVLVSSVDDWSLPDWLLVFLESNLVWTMPFLYGSSSKRIPREFIYGTALSHHRLVCRP